jgi:hypothetical protein
VNKGEYDRCILYSYMEIEELNMCTCSKNGGRRMKENNGRVYLDIL